MKQGLILLMGLFLTLSAFAGTEQFEFESSEQEAQFISLSTELRCLVCQNQSLADSNAALAQDLREEVYKLLKQGQTKQQIIDFLVSRYGDFILYQPPLKLSTLVLWFGPLLILIFAVISVLGMIKKQATETVTELSEQQRDELDILLSLHHDSEKK
ncbi:MAG: cytochrome c-type biogenesis protein CcmH [Piscirickettsiaceae bacterium]|nr:cytochrome c-type biogenesis protein CcmH [Piscirickettsiaceae bacterium]